jgi:hypothetical protein
MAGGHWSSLIDSDGIEGRKSMESETLIASANASAAWNCRRAVYDMIDKIVTMKWPDDLCGPARFGRAAARRQQTKMSMYSIAALRAPVARCGSAHAHPYQEDNDAVDQEHRPARQGR